MERFGFSAGFIAKIKVLYCEFESVLKLFPFGCVKVSGGAVLCLECFINSLLNLHKICSSLRGLVLPGLSRSIILSAYVDDLIVLLEDTDISI